MIEKVINMEEKIINIDDKFIGGNNKTFIIAELSANHGNDIEIAKKTIREVKKAGVDAIKLQTYTPDTITIDCDNEYFQIKQGTIWDGTTLYKLYQEAYTPWEWHKELFETAREEGLICFSTPFDFTAVDFLEKLNVPAYKIASFEINDIPLIEYISSKNKPMIISTGIATLSDIELAISTCLEQGNNQIILLKCTSAYPSPVEEINLKTIDNLAKTFNVVAGISDHSLGTVVPIGAVALGAKVIEKHVILDKSIGGPDSSFSLDMKELKELVDNIRIIEKAIGKVTYKLSDKTLKSKEHSRSLFVVEDIKKGEKITISNIKSIRPAFGMHTKYYKEVIGMVAVCDIKKGTPLSWNLLDVDSK